MTPVGLRKRSLWEIAENDLSQQPAFHRRGPAENITTLKIEGLPATLTREQLMGQIDDLGLEGRYKVLWMPDHEELQPDGRYVRGMELTSALVNFSSHVNVQKFLKEYSKETIRNGVRVGRPRRGVPVSVRVRLPRRQGAAEWERYLRMRELQVGAGEALVEDEQNESDDAVTGCSSESGIDRNPPWPERRATGGRWMRFVQTLQGRVEV